MLPHPPAVVRERLVRSTYLPRSFGGSSSNFCGSTVATRRNGCPALSVLETMRPLHGTPRVSNHSSAITILQRPTLPACGDYGHALNLKRVLHGVSLGILPIPPIRFTVVACLVQGNEWGRCPRSNSTCWGRGALCSSTSDRHEQEQLSHMLNNHRLE